jgi:peptidyl-Lys metalloendopeptidase
MQNKIRISLSRKILYIIAIHAMIFVAFGSQVLQTARASGIETQASTGVLINLSASKASFDATETVVLHLTITNTNNDSVSLLRWFTPADGIDRQLFSVARAGVPVTYLGKLVKHASPTDQDYITLAAGENLNYDVNLSDYYDLSVSGNYEVTYSVDPQQLAGNQVDQQSFGSTSLVSNTLGLFIEGRPAPAIQPIEAQVVTGSTSFVGCSSSQQTDLISARSNASAYSFDAVDYFNSGKNGLRYTTWFGVYDSARYDAVKSHYSSISNAMDTASASFDCSLSGCGSPSWYAYVYPNSPYNFYICAAYWNAPLTGTDSKAGTLIHEMSHFTVVVGTQDYVYGQAGAQALAISNPDQAIMNADSHEYFAENNPPLETGVQPPAGVSATDGTYTDRVRISWTASSGATYYQVYRNTSNSTSGVILLGSPSNSPYDDTSAAVGTTYWYFVKACDSTGCSGFSASDSGFRSGAITSRIYVPLVVRPAPLPGDFNKTAPANGATSQSTSPSLSWGASSLATSYQYCIDTSNNSTCNATWVSTGTNTSAALSGLTASTVYSWQVRANNAYGATYANGGTWWSFTTGSTSPGILNGNFESGSANWTQYSTHGWTVITTSFPGGVTPHSGSYAVWLGGDYDEISYVQQQVTISAGAPYLVYWHWIASEDLCGYDFGGVLVNGSVVDVYDLCSSANTGGWVKHSVNLSAYIGQSVMVQIRSETDSVLNSNLFVDDVSLQASAASGQNNPFVPNWDAANVLGKPGIILERVQPQDMYENWLLRPR